MTFRAPMTTRSESATHRSRLVAALVAGGIVAGSAIPGLASANLFDDEGHRKTAARFIRNFGKFVRWPDSAFPNESAPIKVCSLGAAPFEGELTDELEGKTARRRAFTYSKVDPTDIDAASSCNIVFINTTTAAEAEPLISALDGKPVLTVGAVAGFAQSGGMIGLIELDGGMNMQINKTRLERNELKGSARLYEISR